MPTKSKKRKKKSSLYTNTGYGDVAYGLKMFNKDMGNIPASGLFLSSDTGSNAGSNAGSDAGSDVGSAGGMTEDISEDDIFTDFILKPATEYIEQFSEDENEYSNIKTEYSCVSKLLNTPVSGLFVLLTDADLTTTPKTDCIFSVDERYTGVKMNKYTHDEVKFVEEISNNCIKYTFPSHNYAMRMLKAYEDAQRGGDKTDE